MWIGGNIPNKVDVEWFKRGGGIVGDDHPPAYRFNGGQKAIYWIVVLGGAAVAITGYVLMFPFYGTAIDTMQYAQMIHAVVAMLFVAAMLGHIYIGTIGMEGAFEAMGEGTVDVNWAKEHHRLWLEDEMVAARKVRGPSQPNKSAKTTIHAARLQSRAFCYKGPMRIIGLAGWSGSGKTTLITKLIPRLIARGIRVSTLKHAHHGFDLDQPGKDSFFPPRRRRDRSDHFSRRSGGPSCTSCARSQSGTCAVWSRRCPPSTSCWSRDSSAMPFPSWKFIVPPTASRSFIRKTRISSRLRRTLHCRRRKCR